MPKIAGDFQSSEKRNPFLKLATTPLEATLTITSPHRDIDGDFGKKQTIVDVEYNGQPYSLSLNATSISRIVGELGDDSDKWVGCSLRVCEVKSEKYKKVYKIVTPCFTE